MQSFRYRAVTQDGRIVKGQLHAAHEAGLAQTLAAGGLELISSSTPVHLHRRRAAPQDLIALCHHLSAMLHAGVPFLTCLEDVRGALPHGRLQDTLTGVACDIDGGQPVAAAFARHPDIFGKDFLALLAAGERAGRLAEAFGHLAHHLKWTAATRSKMRKAVRYPAFLLTLAVAVFFFMMSSVVPQVMDFVTANEAELPLSTRALVALADLFAAHWGLFLAVLAGLSGAIPLVRRLSSAAALASDALILHLPFFGALIMKFQMSFFAHHFALMIRNGMDAVHALRAAASSVTNRALAQRLDKVAERLVQGCALAQAFREDRLFPALVVQMIHAGAQSGTLPDSLTQIAEFYDQDARDTTDRLIGAMEPALTLLIGGLLAWIVVAVLGPVYGTLQQMNGG